VPPDIDVPQAKEQNVFNVKVNFLDELLVEAEPLDIEDLKDKAKDFLIATGDGIMAHPVGRETVGKNREVVLVTGANGKTNAAFPERRVGEKGGCKATDCRIRSFCSRSRRRQPAKKLHQGIGELGRQAGDHRAIGWGLQGIAAFSIDFHAE
jgi:hypothetical protein